MKTQDEMRAILTEKAAADDDFRTRLLSNPKGTIQQEFDVEIPEGVEIQVHQDSAETAHLIVPPGPRLAEQQLAQVAGGKDSGVYYCM